MDTTENSEKVSTPEEKPKRFSFLVLMAGILSIGSLAWTTWSLLDLFQVDAMVIEKLGDVSLIGLSTALTMDIVWSATMVAEYQGQKLPVSWGGKKAKTVNILPVIGWVEVLFVAGLLGYHGSTVANGAAAFAAALPVFTKVTWVLALNGLKDPSDLTDDEKLEIAQSRRMSRLTRARTEATTEQHQAEMVEKDRAHEAALADERRRAAIEREKVQAQIEREKLERDAKFEAEKAELEGQNELKAMRQRLSAQLQISTMRTQQEITVERMDAEQELRLRQPLGIQIIQGQVSRPQLTKAEEGELEDDGDAFADLNLTKAQQRKAMLAARYYAADAAEGGLTKAAFAKAIGTGAPRVTEATTDFSPEWFAQNGLNEFLEQAADAHRAAMGR